MGSTYSKETTLTVPPPAKRRRIEPFQIPIPILPRKSGNLLVCGRNDVGQLGMDPDYVIEVSRPSLILSVRNVVVVKAGGMHSLCLTTEGEIWSFGCNDEGALGRDTSQEGSEAIPSKIILPSKAVKISAGDSHSACLTSDGKVFAWGSFRDSSGAIGLGTEGVRKLPTHIASDIVAVDIASGNNHLVVLTQKGHVLTIGCGEQGQLGRLSLRTMNGGSRRGKKPLLTPGPVTKKAKNFVATEIWATSFCTFFRESVTGQIYAFGLNNYNQLGVTKLDKHFENFPQKTKFKEVQSISGGDHHTIVLTKDRKIHAIGRRDYGRLGLGNVTRDADEMTHITSLKKHSFVEVACGENNSSAVTIDGKLFVWGFGTNFQNGTGDDNDIFVPEMLTSGQMRDKKVISVSCGGQHSMFVVEVSSETLSEQRTKRVCFEETTILHHIS